MLSPPGHEITALLQAWNRGDDQALEKLTPLIYEELRRSARRCLGRGRRGNTLETTALINELYLRVNDMNRVSWQNRAHFFAICARQMRWILTDLYRSKQYKKRGAGAERVSLDETPALTSKPSRDLVAISDALGQLETIDPRKSRVVELRFFGGLSVKETAEVLQVSAETVMRDWKMAKAWLLREINGENSDGN
jgi:RNA polymerase sigma factor (TIGR02999 family)